MVTYVYGYSQDGPQGIILEDRIELLFHLPPGVQFCFGDWDPFLDTVVVPAERVEVICNHPNRALFAKIEQWIRRKTVIAQSVHVEMVLYPQLMKNLLPNFLHIGIDSKE